MDWFNFENAGLIEFLGICVAITTFLLGYVLSVRRRRRVSAFEFITQITITEPMITESYKMYDLLLKFQHRTPCLADLTEDELQTVMVVCSFYEFLGLSLLEGLLNRKVILLSRYAAMKQTWDKFEGVIHERREQLGRKYLFGSFEKSVKDFGPKYESLQARSYPEQVYDRCAK